MTKEVNPQLLEDVKNTLMNGGAVDKAALAILYKATFGLELKTTCYACIEDGIKALKHKFGIVKKTKSNHMKNFKWTSDKRYEKASVTIRVGGMATNVNKGNVNDTTAEIIYNNHKYSHLVVPVGEVKETQADPNELAPQVLKVTEPAASDTELKASEVTISTLLEQPNGGQRVKRKYTKRK